MDPWVGKTPWIRERLPSLVFWPGEFHGLKSMGLQKVDRTEQLTLSRLSHDSQYMLQYGTKSSF